MQTGIVGYEESQTVTIAFNAKGHNFKSCDIKPCSGGFPENHYHGCIKKQFEITPPCSFNFGGFHPVCKYLTNAGVRWLTSVTEKPGYVWSDEYQIYINPERWAKMVEAANEFKQCLEWLKQIGKGYVENPIMHKYAMEIVGIKPTQIIQPWMFGHTTKKATCLWIVGLPELKPTNIIAKELRTDEIHKCPPGPNRESIRSKTFPGIAKAMADQWG